MEREKKIRVSERQLLGSLAKWAVAQSPYHRPDNLEKVLDTLHEATKNDFVESYVVTFNDTKQLVGFLNVQLKSIPELAAWNERKNGNQAPYAFVSRYDSPSPDDDFIDLDALIRNVANEIIGEQLD